MSRVSFDQLLEAGSQYGHLKRKWNPHMAPYIFAEKKGIHIIDLHKTVVKVDEAAAAMKQIAKSGKKILFVATKKQAKEAVADNDALMKEIRKSMQEVGRGLKAHLKTRKERKKAREKFDLINIILPEISRKSSQMLGRDEPPLAPVITKIMNAVFIEDEIVWNNERKENICTITMYNYTNRARKYRIFAKWPEREGVEIVEDILRSTRETNGLRKWVLEALDPGEKVEIIFVVSGLEKGDWNETDIFFKGEKDIIGANKIDEKLLKEMKEIEKTKEKTEKVELAKKEHKSNISENIDSGFGRIHDRSRTGDEELESDVSTTERETKEKIHQRRIDHWSE